MEKIQSSGSLARVLDLMDKSSVGFISAFRSYRTLEENLKLTKKLKDIIRNSGFGFIPILGEWKEDKENVSVERTFGISRSQLNFDELLANLVEIGRADKEFNQQAYLIASEGKGYVIAGEDNTVSAGDILETYENISVSTIENWLSQESGGRSTLAKGPKNRSFTFSCGQFEDTFYGYMHMIKGARLSRMKGAPERVWGKMEDTMLITERVIQSHEFTEEMANYLSDSIQSVLARSPGLDVKGIYSVITRDAYIVGMNLGQDQLMQTIGDFMRKYQEIRSSQGRSRQEGTEAMMGGVATRSGKKLKKSPFDFQ